MAKKSQMKSVQSAGKSNLMKTVKANEKRMKNVSAGPKGANFNK